jgi:hypothetical protein
LIIVYNYDQHLHFFNMPDNGTKISNDVLKEAAQLRVSHIPAVPPADSSDDDLRVVFATYGVQEACWDVTEVVKRLLRDNPEGFSAHEDVMGGDPRFGSRKALVVIFDYKGTCYFYTQANDGPVLTKLTLTDATKSN